ncbi:LAMI_0E10022g1_1 [Lachancea mirantina]|uniref:LAMI_0E10022g1_1 n=1 Tax=Lachancea mirantina TaxID=1230905 RepID=A0A1G4JP82_9SACH|nr:LAMI_0E10022g1_1 [Lachancea mirantina]
MLCRRLTSLRSVFLGPYTKCSTPQLRRYAAAASLEGDRCVKPFEVINGKPSLNLQITQRAADRLNEIYKGSKEVLRIMVESGGCHGFQYNLKLINKDLASSDTQTAPEKGNPEDEFEDEDEFGANKDVVYVLADEGAEVVIDEKSLAVLNNTTLTYTSELIGSTFKITGGNMKSSCGCGSSFDVDV